MNAFVEFVCPSGHDRSIAQTTCPRCGAMMVHESEMPRGLATRSHAIDDATRAEKLLAAALFFGSIVCGGIVRLFSYDRSAIAWVAMLGLVTLFALSKLTSSMWVRRAFTRGIEQRARRRYAGLPRTTIAAARDGIVCIAGTGRLLAPATSPGGVPALAYRTRRVRAFGAVPDDATTSVFRAYAGAGEICVTDASGVNALIRTEWVEIVNGQDSGGEIVSPPGSAVEVSGHARRVPVPDVAGPGYRGVAEVLEFEGSEEKPVVIRVIDAKELGAPPTGVRVAVDTGCDAEGCHAEVRSAPRASARSVRSE